MARTNVLKPGDPTKMAEIRLFLFETMEKTLGQFGFMERGKYFGAARSKIRRLIIY